MAEKELDLSSDPRAAETFANVWEKIEQIKVLDAPEHQEYFEAHPDSREFFQDKIASDFKRSRDSFDTLLATADRCDLTVEELKPLEKVYDTELIERAGSMYWNGYSADDVDSWLTRTQERAMVTLDAILADLENEPDDGDRSEPVLEHSEEDVSL